MTATPLRSRRRDRHGRGLRGSLVPPAVTVGRLHVRVPASRTRGERFDELVLDVVEHLEERCGGRLEDVEFAVEDVPPLSTLQAADPDVVLDETAGGGVPLGRLLPGRLLPGNGEQKARVVVYRRPLEARAVDRHDLAELVQDVLVDQVARLLGLDPDELDPPRS